MKKLIYIFLSAVILTSGYSCTDRLETSPTESVGSQDVYSSAENALAIINGMYRAFYVAGWGSNWTHENFGLLGYMLAQDLMGEDHIQNAAGSGWYYNDYAYSIAGDYSVSYGRQGQCWNFFYTLISNANDVISHAEDIQDDPDMANYVLGQAYALRAFCYIWLVQNFQQNDPTLPGVPLYTEPTVAGSEGKGRGTVQEVYDRVNEDYNTAIQLLEATSVTQQHPSHIDKYVAYGLKARAMMVQHNYSEAYQAAIQAMNMPSKKVAQMSEIGNPVNDVSKSNVMWGLAIQTDQAGALTNVYSHIDADAGTTYSKGAQHLISSWLYAQIPETDARKVWWTAPLPESEWVDNSSKKSYVQVKLVFKDPATYTGDFVLMRYEEMALTASEAACHLGDYDNARKYLEMVLAERDPEYKSKLDSYSNTNSVTANTTSDIFSLMDYILLQRRIELWGEFPRMHDIKRLGLGLNRAYETPENNHVAPYQYEPKYKYFIYAIPLIEFDGNKALDVEKDQNPL